MKTQVKIYGIKNCDTMKKVRAWLDAHEITYAFHDYKIAGIAAEILENWVRQLGWEAVLNRAGTTFRNLPDASKANLNASAAIALMQAQPGMIKRPILEWPGGVIAGFKAEIYETNLL